MSEYKTIRERKIEEMLLKDQANAKEQNEETLYLASLVEGLAMIIQASCNVVEHQKKSHAIEISSLQHLLTKTDEIAAVKQLFAMIDTFSKMKENAAQIQNLFHGRIF